MTQVVVNDEGVDFKIINFRPYLAQTRNLDFLGEELSANATDKQRLAHAKAMDLFNFGTAIF